MLARQGSQLVTRLLSMRQGGLKNDALNGGQSCCLRMGRVQEELSHPVPPTLDREVWGPVSMLEMTREHIRAICRIGNKDRHWAFATSGKAGESTQLGIPRGLGQCGAGCMDSEKVKTVCLSPAFQEAVCCQDVMQI